MYKLKSRMQSIHATFICYELGQNTYEILFIYNG